MSMMCTYAVVSLDVYSAVSVVTMAILLGALAHAVIQRPRRRSVGRHKSRTSTLTRSWSLRLTQTSPRLQVTVVVAYVSLRLVHALLLTFSVASLLIQVAFIY